MIKSCVDIKFPDVSRAAGLYSGKTTAFNANSMTVCTFHDDMPGSKFTEILLKLYSDDADNSSLTFSFPVAVSEQLVKAIQAATATAITERLTK